MAFYQHATFEAWAESVDLAGRYDSVKGVAFAAAKEAWEGARSQEKLPPPPPPPPPSVMDQTDWEQSRRDEGECACRNCWNRYIQFYGSKNG